MASHTYQDPIGFYEWFDDLPYAIQDSILKHLPHIEARNGSSSLSLPLLF